FPPLPPLRRRPRRMRGSPGLRHGRAVRCRFPCRTTPVPRRFAPLQGVLPSDPSETFSYCLSSAPQPWLRHASHCVPARYPNVSDPYRKPYIARILRDGRTEDASAIRTGPYGLRHSPGTRWQPATLPRHSNPNLASLPHAPTRKRNTHPPATVSAALPRSPHGAHFVFSTAPIASSTSSLRFMHSASDVKLFQRRFIDGQAQSRHIFV